VCGWLFCCRRWLPIQLDVNVVKSAQQQVLQSDQSLLLTFNKRIRTFVFDWQLLLEAGLSSTSVELTSAAATATSGIESVF
jgi:hypothetical protein